MIAVKPCSSDKVADFRRGVGAVRGSRDQRETGLSVLSKQEER